MATPRHMNTTGMWISSKPVPWITQNNKHNTHKTKQNQACSRSCVSASNTITTIIIHGGQCSFTLHHLSDLKTTKRCRSGTQGRGSPFSAPISPRPTCIRIPHVPRSRLLSVPLLNHDCLIPRTTKRVAFSATLSVVNHLL